MALANTMPYTNDAKTRVSTLVFSRPKQRNAAHPSTMIDWLLGVRRAAEDPNCSILVLTGLDDALSPLDANKPGRNFYCSGIETNLATDPSKVTDEDLKLGLAVWRELIASLISFPKLLVCAVNGNAIGFGFTTMGLADFVFARQGVGLLAPFTRVGVPPGACSTAIFPKIFGERLANEVLIEGRRVTAKEAEGKFVKLVYVPREALNRTFAPANYFSFSPSSRFPAKPSQTRRQTY